MQYVLYVMVCEVCHGIIPYGAHYYFMLFTCLSDPIKSHLCIKPFFSQRHCQPPQTGVSLILLHPLLATHEIAPIFMLQGDMGGERVLQKKWTTFLKAQLLCSLPDDGFPFNIIQDMFVLTPSPEDWKNTVFYGVFTSQWWGPTFTLLMKRYPQICCGIVLGIIFV